MSDAFDAMVQGILEEQTNGTASHDPSVTMRLATPQPKAPKAAAAVPREKPKYREEVEGKVHVEVGGPWQKGEAVKFPKGYVRLTLRGTWNSLCMYEDELAAVAKWFAEEYPKHKAELSEGLKPLSSIAKGK